jgi:DNA-binding transcriptional LysR family regulator
MNTDLIRQFRTVIEAGTLATAAEHLHLTPSALSRAMKRLEAELDCALFTPSGRNLLPTPEAQKFYASSGAILRGIDDAKAVLQKRAPAVRELRLSTFEVFSTHFSGWMIETLDLPCTVTLLEAPPGKIEEQILSGISDFGLTYAPELNPELDHLAIGEVSFAVHVSTRAKGLDLPYAVPITRLNTPFLPTQTLDGWPVGVPRTIRYRFEMLETALDLASRGLAQVICPEFLVKIENERLNARHQLERQSIGIPLPKFKVYAIKKKNHPEDATFKQICKAVRMVLRK